MTEMIRRGSPLSLYPTYRYKDMMKVKGYSPGNERKGFWMCSKEGDRVNKNGMQVCRADKEWD